MVSVRKKIVLGIISVCLCSFLLLPVQTLAQDLLQTILLQYQDYEERFAAVEKKEDISGQGFTLIEDQCFLVQLSWRQIIVFRGR